MENKDELNFDDTEVIVVDETKIPKEHKSNWLFNMMPVFLALSILFSIIQSVYIYKLSTGQIGNMTYMNGRDTSPVEAEVQETSPLADPNFSLEEAASVYDPNKTTLTTMEIVNQVGPATVSVYILENKNDSVPVSSGSGFVISADGYVVTNQHVIADAIDGDYYVMVRMPDHNDPIEAFVVGADEQTDVAVLKLAESDTDYPYVTLGLSDVLQQGELVVAIGNPLGSLDGTVTVGVVSALNRQMNNNGYTLNLLQTDASINHGNSGGPLINSFGEVIGITNAKMGSAEGLGFAIPIDDVKDIIESLINFGYVANRTYLGISVSTQYENAFYGSVEGIYVAEITAGGPGDRAGFQVGDRIISMDGIEITESSDIIDIRNSHVAGDSIPVVVERDGQEMEITLIVGDSYLGK